MSLPHQWLALLHSLGISSQAGEDLYQLIKRHHNQEIRAYHNLEHIRQMLAGAQSLKPEVSAWSALLLAIWFHDVIYDPQGMENERKSAQFAQNSLHSLGMTSQLIETTSELILVTTHQPPLPKSKDAQIICDLDLAILGAEKEAYARYAAAIRREYAPVALDLYRRGRQTVLGEFLRRDRIYLTETYYRKLEANARRNLEGEIKTL